MNQITEGNRLEMTNVLSFRGKVTQQEMIALGQEMDELIKEAGAKRVGNAVSATFNVTQERGQVVLDVEILIPLDKPIEAPVGYQFKPVFRLTNAVKIRHEGKPELIQQSGQELMEYVQERKLMPITVGYTVTTQTPTNLNNMQSYIIEMYVGVSDNIL